MNLTEHKNILNTYLPNVANSLAIKIQEKHKNSIQHVVRVAFFQKLDNEVCKEQVKEKVKISSVKIRK